MAIDFTFTPEQEKLKQKAHDFALKYKPYAAEWDEKNYCPFDDIVIDARNNGLLGLTMAKEYGGQDLTVVDYVLVEEELIRTSTTWALGELIFSTTGPGPSVLMRADNEPVKKKYLKDVVTGYRRCAITLTEPKYGSNLNDLETNAREEADCWVVNGSKRFITGAVDNELYSTFCRFNNVPGSRGIGAIMIEKGTPGVSVIEGPAYVGTRGVPHGELYFEDARIPKENLESREGRFGEIMEAFNMERMHNACYSLSYMELAFDEAAKYAKARKQWGRPVVQFQSIYHRLAEMWMNIEAQRYLTYHAASTSAEGKYPKMLDVTVAKAFGSQMLPNMMWLGLSIHGGDGCTLAFPIQRYLRDALIGPMGGGTLETLKNVIAGVVLNEKLSQYPGK